MDTHARQNATLTHTRFAAGETIVKAGEAATEAFIIERGDAAAWREHGGHRTLLAQLGPGQMVGGVAILEERHHSATVTAVSDCSVRKIAADDLTNHLSGVHPVVHTLIDTLIDRLSWRGLGTSASNGALGAATPVEPTRSPLAEHWAARRLALQLRPVVALDNNSLAGCYQHPVLAVPGQAPARIGDALAKETDTTLLQAIRHWLLAAACEAVAEDAGRERFVGVGLRGRLASTDGLVDDVTSAIAQADIAPTQLWLVIREDELPAANSDAWAALQTCRRAGVRLVISEFGARLAPMAIPLRGEVDAVALAHELIAKPHGYSALTDDINRLSRDANLHLLATGTDCERTRSIARALGCQFGASANASASTDEHEAPVAPASTDETADQAS